MQQQEQQVKQRLTIDICNEDSSLVRITTESGKVFTIEPEGEDMLSVSTWGQTIAAIAGGGVNVLRIMQMEHLY